MAKSKTVKQLTLGQVVTKEVKSALGDQYLIDDTVSNILSSDALDKLIRGLVTAELKAQAQSVK